eukprot:TRINITY_DN1615_c0_g1_i2.p1 TRINITY_DN1615_c0_g1~~TRINITY_DN1615_c0_g1_i2.p1  ORF type:complete len:114 (+),score=24.45 TRINITY_DN1615_c0_g1_i2:3-344(+)
MDSMGGLHTHVVKEEENDKTWTVKVGDTVEFRLDSNPTTGFDWHVIEAGAPTLEFVSREMTGVPRGLCGAGGTRKIVLKAIAAGSVTVELHYKRSWEKTGPASTFKATVTVQE